MKAEYANDLKLTIDPHDGAFYLTFEQDIPVAKRDLEGNDPVTTNEHIDVVTVRLDGALAKALGEMLVKATERIERRIEVKQVENKDNFR